MAGDSDDAPRGRSRDLGPILKTLRRRRGLRPAEVAARMGMPLRSYEHFEGGFGRLNLPRLKAFAEATATDPYAILAALEFNAPDLAVHSMDNHLVSVVLLSLAELDDRAGELIARLDTRTLITLLAAVLQELAEAARRRQALLDSWLNGRDED